MRRKITALLVLTLPALLWAAGPIPAEILPGDPLQAVLKQKGDPINTMTIRNVKILLYRDVEIRVENNLVVTVTPRVAPPAEKPAGVQPKPKSKPR